jgi:hypothetical protein
MRGTVVLKAGATKRKPAPEFSRDAQLDLPDFPELDELLGDLPDLPGLGFDLEALDKLLDLEPGKGRSFCVPLKNARARDMGYSGEGARKSKQICGAKTRTGKPCQAPGNGRGARCKLHGGKSTGPKTQAGKARSLAALRGNHPSRKAYPLAD